MSKRLSDVFPSITPRTIEIPEPGTKKAFRRLIDILEGLRRDISGVVNFNRVLYFNQNGAPTTVDVLEGQFAVWKDADATSSNSTHYLVYNDAGTIVTFASVETVP